MQQKYNLNCYDYRKYLDGMSLRDLRKEIIPIFMVKRSWGYCPKTREEFQQVAEELKVPLVEDIEQGQYLLIVNYNRLMKWLNSGKIEFLLHFNYGPIFRFKNMFKNNNSRGLIIYFYVGHPRGTVSPTTFTYFLGNLLSYELGLIKELPEDMRIPDISLVLNMIDKFKYCAKKIRRRKYYKEVQAKNYSVKIYPNYFAIDFKEQNIPYHIDVASNSSVGQKIQALLAKKK